MKEQKPVLSVRVSQETLDLLARLEERTGVGRAEIVERALWVGLKDEEEFVNWLESSIKGPFVNMLFHPTLLKTIMGITGSELDPMQQKVRENVTARRKAKGRTNPKTA